MIKIEKNLASVPDSLQLPTVEFFPNGIPTPPKTTDKRRLELIAAGEYKNEEIYNSRYKQSDTQIALRSIYRNKCAFCEQKVEQSHVEHYRPKSKYWWLTYSWDNLLLACSTCNSHKGDEFEILGTQASFTNTPASLKAIHSSSSRYDMVERPKMINPEVTNPDGKIQFNPNGKIESKDVRFKYTIETCKVDRKFLNDERRKISDVLKRDIKSAIIDNDSVADQEAEISILIRKFIRDSQDEELQFLAFRRYMISKKWINEIVKTLTEN